MITDNPSLREELIDYCDSEIEMEYEALPDNYKLQTLIAFSKKRLSERFIVGLIIQKALTS